MNAGWEKPPPRCACVVPRRFAYAFCFLTPPVPAANAADARELWGMRGKPVRARRCVRPVPCDFLASWRGATVRRDECERERLFAARRAVQRRTPSRCRAGTRALPQASTELDWHDREIRFDVKIEHLELRRGEVRAVNGTGAPDFKPRAFDSWTLC